MKHMVKHYMKYRVLTIMDKDYCFVRNVFIADYLHQDAIILMILGSF